jgi:hypothetical protein
MQTYHKRRCKQSHVLKAHMPDFAPRTFDDSSPSLPLPGWQSSTTGAQTFPTVGVTSSSSEKLSIPAIKLKFFVSESHVSQLVMKLAVCASWRPKGKRKLRAGPPSNTGLFALARSTHSAAPTIKLIEPVWRSRAAAEDALLVRPEFRTAIDFPQRVHGPLRARARENKRLTLPYTQARSLTRQILDLFHCVPRRAFTRRSSRSHVCFVLRFSASFSFCDAILSSQTRCRARRFRFR